MNAWKTISMALIVGVCSLTAQVDPGTENLTHWWSFDDGTANDQVGAAHGTVVGDAEISGGSLHIDALDQWVELPAEIIAISDYSAVTVAVWFTPLADANNGYHMVVYFGDSVNGFGANGFFISPCRGDNVSRAAISCGVETNPWERENGVNGPETNDGLLHHMVVTIDNAEIGFYVDGILMGTTELTGDNALWNISTNYAYIGRGGYTADPVLLSSIHDVRVYNRVLGDGEVEFLYQAGPNTSVSHNGNAQPQNFRLEQNYPNPFNPSTTVEYSLPKASSVKMTVYNMAGEQVAVLVDGFQQAGLHKVTWSGTDDFGRPLNSGVYLYKLQADHMSVSKKMIMMK